MADGEAPTKDDLLVELVLLVGLDEAPTKGDLQVGLVLLEVGLGLRVGEDKVVVVDF